MFPAGWIQVAWMARRIFHLWVVDAMASLLFQYIKKSWGYLTSQFLSPLGYWENRAQIYGKRAVLNLGHPETEFEAVTDWQKQEIFPHLVSLLRGNERLVLDLGCGPGRFTGDLALATQAQVIGVDPIPALIELAPRADHVDYRIMTEGAIPLGDRCVDVVWICLVLGGLQGAVLDRTINEIERVLRPDGLVFLVENTSSRADVKHWQFRPISEYQRLFPWLNLAHLHDYTDLGEQISVLAGRRR